MVTGLRHSSQGVVPALDAGNVTELVAQERIHDVGVEAGGQRVEVAGEELDQAGGDGLLDDAQRRLLRLSGLSGQLLRLSGRLPYLAEPGERWQRGTVSIATKHFASNLIRGQLAGLARGWGSGTGRRPCWPARPPSFMIWR